MTTAAQQVLEFFQQTDPDRTDGQLLARFLTTQDEAAFAALVRRHGSMVLGVCRRILHNVQDAEDAFQAAFLILAQKASSVLKRESLGCWLYQVAYHTSLEARAANDRRRAMERQMKDMPHPEVAPTEPQDWRPLLDRELNLLPEKYRAAVILCDLEVRSRKEAARQLDIPEGTLSSRLATAHKMLAKRLAGSGIALSGGVLAAAMLEGTASAQVATTLVCVTARSAALAAAHQLTAVSTPVVVLMKGVLKAMLLKKLKLTSGLVMMLAALGAMTLGYCTSRTSAVAQGYPPNRALNELEALRKENELLKLNLQLVLEKVRSQEEELRALKGPKRGSGMPGMMGPGMPPGMMGPGGPPMLVPATPSGGPGTGIIPVPGMPPGGTEAFPPGGKLDFLKEAESALAALRESNNKETQQRAVDTLAKALKKLSQQRK